MSPTFFVRFELTNINENEQTVNISNKVDIRLNLLPL